MRIEYVTYKRIVNLGNQESESFEATGTLNETDDPNVAVGELRVFVERQVRARETLEQMLARHYSLAEEIEKHERRVEHIRKTWILLEQKLEGSGMTMDNILEILEIPL